MKITEIKNITDFNINDVPKNTVLIFDIDDTLISYIDGKGFTLTDPNLPTWLHEIYIREYPIVCLTARYTPTPEQKYVEQYVFSELGLYPLLTDETTRHDKIKIVNYTNASFKGPHAYEILYYYRSIGYDNYLIFEDRLEQIYSILSHVYNGHGVLIKGNRDEIDDTLFSK